MQAISGTASGIPNPTNQTAKMNIPAAQGQWLHFAVMSNEEVEAHARKYSKAFTSNYSPWKTNFEEMAKKTVLKKALKYAPMKTEFVRGMVQDMTVKTELSEDMYTVTDTSDLVEYTDDVPATNQDTGEVVDNA